MKEIKFIASENDPRLYPEYCKLYDDYVTGEICKTVMYEALKLIDEKYNRCVICKNLKEAGHDYNCPIMQALAKAEGK